MKFLEENSLLLCFVAHRDVSGRRETVFSLTELRYYCSRVGGSGLLAALAVSDANEC